MEESYENVSQQSNYMDLTKSPEINRSNVEHNSNKLDRPPRNFGRVNNLRSLQELPAKYRCIFEFPFFNIIQSNVLNDVLYSDVSVVISAPTGSGKTVVFELAIVRLLMKFEETNFCGDYKIVYVAPVKALCHERLSEWHTKFSKIGISCIVCTGDSDNIDTRCLKNYNIIITTPEKWDCLTRNAKDYNIVESVKLFMIDEVHLLNEEVRGPNLEVIVSRMKILNKNQNVRLIAVSATIPNTDDIAQWLGNNDKPAVYFKIGEELRPVKLNKIVNGYVCASETATFKFDLTLNYKLQNVLMEYAEGKPTLIFCSTRKGVELTASHLLQNLTFHLSPVQLSRLSSASSTMFSALHKSFISSGIGCHHAGMSLENRATVEKLFREGQLPVLVATSTLAMGVNLPAHLVVVKGTKQYVGGGFQEYSESSVLQMIGRAGRPQFDTSATVVIMTTMKEKQRYEKMLGGTELIESNLHRHLTEHLNAEVVLGTITDIAIALEWLRYTFLYIRVLKNPKHYNIPNNFTKNQIEKKLQDLCQIEINALHKYGMLQIDQIDGFSVSPTDMGTLMANYYLAFSTMKLFTEIKGTESLADILMLLCKCTEFSDSYLRVNDKKTLNTLNKCKYQETIRFPVKGLIKTTPMKIYCIIQATFGCIRIQNPTLSQEAIKIMRLGERIAKCLVIYLLHKNKYFSALLNALILNQCFNAKLWENSLYVSRQFPKIGVVLSSMLVSAGKNTFKAILETSPRDIERIINRAPPMGNEIIEAVMSLPFYKINLEPSESDKFKIKITVTLLNSDDIIKKCTAGLNSYMTFIIGDTDNNILVCKKLYHHTMATCKEYIQYVDVIIKKDHVVKVYLISENWVGIDCKQDYDIIVNEDKISTKSSTAFVNSNNNSNSANQRSINSYFKTTKNVTSTGNKKPNLRNTKTKTIDTYFSKQKNTNQDNSKNTKLGFLVPSKNVPNPENATIIVKETSTNDNAKYNRETEKESEISNATPKNNSNNYNTVKNKITNNSNNHIYDSGFISNETQSLTQLNNYNENYTPHNYKPIINIPSLIPSQIASIFEEENLEDSITNKTNENTNYLQDNSDEFDNNYNSYDFNNEPQIIINTNQNNFKRPYTQDLNNYSSNIKENKKLLLKNNYLTQPGDFKSFSQNLATKFSQFPNISSCSGITNSQKLSQNTFPINRKLNSKENIPAVAKEIEKNIKIKSTLSKFKYSPPKKINHNFVETKLSTNDKKPVNKSIVFSQNKDVKSISLPQNTEKSVKPNTCSITNEELENFKRFMQNKQQMKKNISSTITRETQIQELNHSQNKNEELYPMQLCDVIYGEENSNIDEFVNIDDNINDELNKTNEKINISSDNSSEIDENCNEIIILSDTEEKREKEDKNIVEKPSFPKTFREYVQNSIDKLKKSTLVNEHFNYDFGFQEFLMGPLDETSSEENNETEEKSIHNEEKNVVGGDDLETSKFEESHLKNPENELRTHENNLEMQNYPQYINQISPYVSEDVSFENVANITFSETGNIIINHENDDFSNITFATKDKLINKNENIESQNDSLLSIESLEYNFQREQNISYSSSFNSNIFTNEPNFEVEKTTKPQFIQKNENDYQSNENSYENSCFSLNGFPNETNYEVEQTVQTQFFQNSDPSDHSFDSQNDFTEKTTLKMESKIKLIEQFYSSPMFTMQRDENKFNVAKYPDLLPFKRQKLPAPALFPITRNKKYFKDPIKDNDPLKKMPSLKKILSTHGSQYENKISLAKNEMENQNLDENITSNSYNYSTKETKKSVELSVTIYEKQENSIFGSYKTGEPKKDERKNKNLPFSRPYFQH